MSYIVTLDTNRMWITDPADPGGAALVCGSLGSSGVPEDLDGEVRYYAGNRAQGAVRDQDKMTAPYTLRHLSPTDLALAIAWRGKTVLVRTKDGERFYGVYFNTTRHRLFGTVPDDGSAEVTYDVDVTFERVSFNEAV